MKTRQTSGFTLIELLIVVAIIGIIAAIAVPRLLRARLAGNEASAIGSLHAINTAQATFSATCAHGGFVVELGYLGFPPTGSEPGAEGFISPDLGQSAINDVEKFGYMFNVGQGVNAVYLGRNNCSGVHAWSKYFAEGHPRTFDQTGNRTFGTDNRATIFESDSPAHFTAASVESASASMALR